MKNLRKDYQMISRLVICLLLISFTESQAQVIKMSAKDLTSQSTAVICGKCSRVQSEWNTSRSMILTHVTVIPEQYIKGNLGTTVTITVPGGTVGDIFYEVSDMPVFIEGEEVVAFVWTNPDGRNLITGGAQGKMKIDKDPQTGKKMVHGTISDVDNESVSQELDKTDNPGKPEKVPLDDFLTKLKEYVKH